MFFGSPDGSIRVGVPDAAARSLPQAVSGILQEAEFARFSSHHEKIRTASEPSEFPIWPFSTRLGSFQNQSLPIVVMSLRDTRKA